MATILTKRSNTASSVPLAADLTNSTSGAELAVNTADKRLFTKDSGGTVVELGTNPSSLTLTGGTANGVPYLNGSKVLTTGSALQFDGSNLGLGVTPSAWGSPLASAMFETRNAMHFGSIDSTSAIGYIGVNAYYNGTNWIYKQSQESCRYELNSNSTGAHAWYTAPSGTAGNAISFTQAMTLDASGNLLVGTTDTSLFSNTSGEGIGLLGDRIEVASDSADSLRLNRMGTDGTIVIFYGQGTQEGTISVSGTTVSYNGGHLARFAQTVAAKDDSLKKGTVLSNLDEMNSYTDAEGNAVENEQLNKVKVSDVEGDVNVAGVFVNWSFDEQHNVDEINMAMTGDMIIRIAQGVTVQRGDLLMSAGDGTAKPQGDDIVRAKTIAKVTSTHVTCTYEDGSFCVPCVLMAC
jgi:hypothetical protein